MSNFCSCHPPVMGQMTWPKSVIDTSFVSVPTGTVWGIEHFIFHANLNPFLIIIIDSLFHINTFEVNTTGGINSQLRILFQFLCICFLLFMFLYKQPKANDHLFIYFIFCIALIFFQKHFSIFKIMFQYLQW